MLLVLLIISRLSVLHHKHPHELLDSFVKERFEPVFRLVRGRAFYSSLSICQAFVFRNLFLLNRLPLSIQSVSSAGGESYSILKRCQPPLSTASDHLDRSYQQDPTSALSARRILLEFAASATFSFA